MNNSSPIELAKFHWFPRLLSLGGGGVLLSLLATAACLEPDSRGYGTHQKLGFPPCTFKVVFGVRCPACGMTTSWAYMSRGKALDSLRANAGGALLAVAAILAGPWLFASGLRGRWLCRPPSEMLWIIFSLTILAATVLDWSIRFFLVS